MAVDTNAISTLQYHYAAFHVFFAIRHLLRQETDGDYELNVLPWGLIMEHFSSKLQLCLWIFLCNKFRFKSLTVICVFLLQIFGVPNHHPRSQPFFDRVYTFSVVDDKVFEFSFIYKKQENFSPVSDIFQSKLGQGTCQHYGRLWTLGNF